MPFPAVWPFIKKKKKKMKIMLADPTFLTAFQYAPRTTGIPTNAISRMSTEC